MINQEQMDNNWTELMSIIDTHFEGEQKEPARKENIHWHEKPKANVIKNDIKWCPPNSVPRAFG